MQPNDLVIAARLPRAELTTSHEAEAAPGPLDISPACLWSTAGLKDNPYLYKGVLAGVLRISKESLFSGLNNLAVYGPTAPKFGTAFGFTDEEVLQLLQRAGCPEQLERVAAWYDGYALADRPIYNPWSIISFLDSSDRVLRPHWVATGSEDLLRQVLLDQGLGLRSELLALIEGATLSVPMEESTALRDLDDKPEAIWSFLVHTGYLTAEPLEYGESGAPRARVRIPNREVRNVYITMLSQWLGNRAGGESAA